VRHGNESRGRTARYRPPFIVAGWRGIGREVVGWWQWRFNDDGFHWFRGEGSMG
jgi:hypothetical protein